MSIDWLLIDSTNQSTLKPDKTEQLTNRQSKVRLLVGRGREHRRQKVVHSMCCWIWQQWTSSENIKLGMWYFPQNFTYRVLRKTIPWLHKIAFLVEMYGVHWYWCKRRRSPYVHMYYEADVVPRAHSTSKHTITSPWQVQVLEPGHTSRYTTLRRSTNDTTLTIHNGCSVLYS